MVAQYADSAACRILMATLAAILYIGSIETAFHRRGDIMNISLGLRTLAVLAFVAASTTVILKPELTGGAGAARLQALPAVAALNHG
jgi:hypothetical protein